MGDINDTKRLRGDFVQTTGCEDRFGGSATLYGHGSALLGHFVYVFGGCSQKLFRYGVFALDVNTWHWKRCDSPKQALTLKNHLMVLVNDGIYVFAGYGQSRLPKRPLMWRFDVIEQSFDICQAAGEALIPVGQAAGEYLEELDMIVVYGGLRRMTPTSRVIGYSCRVNEWSVLKTKGHSRKRRFNHSSCRQGKSRILFYGGNETSFLRPCDDMFVLSCVGRQLNWSEVTCSPVPLARANASMCCTGDRIFIFGGFHESNGLLSDHLYTYSLKYEAGVEFKGLKSKPAERKLKLRLRGQAWRAARHTAIVSKGRVVLVGRHSQWQSLVYVISPGRRAVRPH